MSEENKKELSIVQKVENKLVGLAENDELHFPANYSVSNALKSAWSILQTVKDKDGELALNTCSARSIYNALYDMGVQGLNPVKNQCYFIPYGDELSLMRSYHGTKAVVKRLKNVSDIFAQVIYEGDDFNYDIVDGVISDIKHKQDIFNIDITKIKGAYCVIKYYDPVLEDVCTFSEVMSIRQIYQSWLQSRQYPFEGSWVQKGKSKQFVPKEPLTLKEGTVHYKFTEEMAKRSVINRAAKQFFHTSDDSDLLMESIHRTNESEYASNDSDIDKLEIVEDEIDEKQASKVIEVDPEPVTEKEPENDVKQAPGQMSMDDDEDIPDIFKEQ